MIEPPSATVAVALSARCVSVVVSVTVVLTGRNAPAELIELADTVTEMTLIKHHFNAGVPAQRGIED